MGYRAANETGPDWAGSDEIYGIFEDAGRGIRVRTLTQGDVDTGNTRNFDANQSCMAPINVLTRNSQGRPRTWACDGAGVGAPFSVRFSLYENDENMPWDHCFNGNGPQVEPDCEDNHIGSRLVIFSEADLRASLPNVGASVERTATLGGYRFIYRITRVQNEVTLAPPVPGRGIDAVQVHRSGTLSAVLSQQFEFDSGTVVASNGDFAFGWNLSRLTPVGGARIWPGGASARGHAACTAGGANYVTTQVALPPIGSHACYITSEGRVGEFRVDNLAGATLTLSYTTWR